jgi:hypothetical protein
MDAGVFVSNRMCTRLSVLALSAILLIGAVCKDPYTYNHNLVQLYSNSEYAAFNPVPSLDGRTIYFLADSADARSRDYSVYTLHGSAYALADSSSRELLRGDFYSLALSPDGKRILLASFLSDSTSLLVIADTSGNIEDSLKVSHPKGYESPKPEYLWHGTGVVYNVVNRSGPTTTAFYSRQLSGDSSSVVVLSVPWEQVRFCVLDGDSIYADSATYLDPAVSPSDRAKVAYSYGSSFSGLGLYDRKQRKKSALAAPYQVTSIGNPAWMPGGHDLLMVANKREADGGFVVRPFEIWLLKAAVE